jgi:hypothetical protein
MANILRTPSAGQPIDATYLLEIAKAVNDLSDRIAATSTMQYLTVDTKSVGKQSIKTSEARIIGAYTDVFSGTVTANQEKEWSIDFPPDFKYPPIITATPVAITGSSSGTGVSVVIKTISKSKVTGVVSFSTGGNFAIGVNVIIVGIPN